MLVDLHLLIILPLHLPPPKALRQVAGRNPPKEDLLIQRKTKAITVRVLRIGTKIARSSTWVVLRCLAIHCDVRVTPHSPPDVGSIPIGPTQLYSVQCSFLLP